MKIVTRATAIANLKQQIGQDLYDLADRYGITTYKGGKQNKGWKGLVLERIAGLDTNISQAPNGLSFELKSVSFYERDGELVPKETMAITMINPETLKDEPFFESHVWAKLKSIIFCAVMWHGKNAHRAELLDVANLDFAKTDDLIREIKEDYELVQHKIVNEGFESLSGRDGKWIQPRTKGPGHGSTSRAFYARKALVQKIFDTATLIN